jgi:glycerophosphoryl diester phosphodiesterase
LVHARPFRAERAAPGDAYIDGIHERTPAAMHLIAHRGASARAPENSLTAFAAAVDARVHGIETDVRMTADGGLVLMHDDDVSRTTEGAGRVSEMAYDEVRLLVTADGRAVPSLDEFLALCAGRARAYLELKATLGPEGFRSAAAVARASLLHVAAGADVTFSSFDPAATEAVRAEAPHLRTALSVSPFAVFDDALALALDAGHAELHLSDAMVEEPAVARALEAGLGVAVWTVNDPARALRLRAWGVGAIFTDDPAALRAALDATR